MSVSLVSEDTLNVIANAQINLSPSERARAFRYMKAVNLEAIRERYGDGHAKSAAADAAGYQYRDTPPVEIISKKLGVSDPAIVRAQIAHCATCFEYQCEDSPEWEDSMSKTYVHFARKFCDDKPRQDTSSVVWNL